MKKNLIVLFFVLLAVGYGCESEYEDYHGADVIYMNEDTDTLRVSFTYVDNDTLHAGIKVKTIGDVCDYDRVVNLSFAFEHIKPGVDIEPLAEQYVIKAGENSLVIPIVMKRTEALQKEEKRITMELHENEFFKTYYSYGAGDRITWVRTDRLKFTLIFSEFMTTQPPYWDKYMLGDFSPKKFRLICEVTKIEREKFLDYWYMVYRASYIGSSMKKYLAAEKAADRTVYEEDGVTEMTMRPYAQ